MKLEPKILILVLLAYFISIDFLMFFHIFKRHSKSSHRLVIGAPSFIYGRTKVNRLCNTLNGLMFIRIGSVFWAFSEDMFTSKPLSEFPVANFLSFHQFIPWVYYLCSLALLIIWMTTLFLQERPLSYPCLLYTSRCV